MSVFYRKFPAGLPVKIKTNYQSMVKAGRNDFSISPSLNLFTNALSIPTVTCSNNYYNLQLLSDYF